MSYYPIALDLRGRRVLVVGGGLVAERKVQGLLAAGAAVTVVSPTLTDGLMTLVSEDRVRHAAHAWHPFDLSGFTLVFAATDDRAVNALVAGEGRRQGVWVNAADDPSHCDFILPAVVRRGDLVVAVTTGGRSPTLARLVREELETYLSDDYAALIEVVGEVRRELVDEQRSPDPETWRRALDGDLRRLVAAGEREAAKRRLRERLGAA